MQEGFDMGFSSIQYATGVTTLPPTNDYTQLAHDMSDYLIWNANEFTSWPDMRDT